MLLVSLLVSIPVFAQETENGYMLFDFNDDVLHDANWLMSQPAGTQGHYVDVKGDSGIAQLTLAEGEGPDGSNCLLVTCPDEKSGIPSFYVLKGTNRGGWIGRIGSENGYLLPRGIRANRIRMKVRFEEGFRDVYSQQPGNRAPYKGNVDFGTYHYNPGRPATGSGFVESNNWHFYHRLWIRHDKAQDEWIDVIINETPQHQRDVAFPTQVNPTRPYVNYWEGLTRFYWACAPYKSDPEKARPVKMWVDDIEFIYDPPKHPITVEFANTIKGQRINVVAGSSHDIPIRILNAGTTEIRGTLTHRSNSYFSPQILDVSGVFGISAITLAPESTFHAILRVTVDSNYRIGQQRDVGIAFVPDDQLTENNTSFSTPYLEQQYWQNMRAHDAHVYGTFIRARIEEPATNNRPEGKHGLIYRTPTNNPISEQIRSNDPDPGDNENILFELLEKDDEGILNLEPNGMFNYIPQSGFNGVYRFTYKIKDAHGAESPVGVQWIRIEEGIEPIPPIPPEQPIPPDDTDRLLARIQALEAQVQILEVENAALEQENTELKLQIAALEAEVSRLETELAVATALAEEYKRKLDTPIGNLIP